MEIISWFAVGVISLWLMVKSIRHTDIAAAKEQDAYWIIEQPGTLLAISI